MARKATQHYCPQTENNRHKWVKWMNESHPNTGASMGPKSHVVLHCQACGIIKK